MKTHPILALASKLEALSHVLRNAAEDIRNNPEYSMYTMCQILNNADDLERMVRRYCEQTIHHLDNIGNL